MPRSAGWWYSRVRLYDRASAREASGLPTGFRSNSAIQMICIMLMFPSPNHFPTRTRRLPFCLTKKELQELTLKIHHGAQVRALAEMGIRYIVRPDGSPAVLHSALDEVPISLRRTSQPDFSSLEP